MRMFQRTLASDDRSVLNTWPRVVAACDLAFSYAVSGWFSHARMVIENTRLENKNLLETNDLMRYRVVLQEANLDLLETGGMQAAVFAQLFMDLAQKVYLSHQDAVNRQVRFFTLVAQLHTLDWERALAQIQAESGAESRHRYLTRMYVLYRFFEKNDNQTEAKRIVTMYYDAKAELVTTYSNQEEPPLDAKNEPLVARYSPKTQRRLAMAYTVVTAVVLLLRPLISVWNGSVLAGLIPLVVFALSVVVWIRRIDRHKLCSILLFLLFAITYLLIQTF
jgi:FtsH-binding integral membrane protein